MCCSDSVFSTRATAGDAWLTDEDVLVSAVNPSLNQPILQPLLSSASVAASAYESSVHRWTGYLQRVLPAPGNQDMNMQWLAVKALQTLLNNWRAVPGVGEGVLPSYNNYDSGMWSWDTCLLRQNESSNRTATFSVHWTLLKLD